MKRVFQFIFPVVAVLTLAPAAWADNPSDFLHNRTYVGFVVTSVSVDPGGEFSGLNYSRVNLPAYEITLLPSLAQNFGYGILVGHREEAYAIELSYWQSNHTASFGPGVVNAVNGATPVTFSGAYQDTAVYQSINVDFKRYFLTDLDIQPFLGLGVSFPWITLPNADADSNGDVGSVTLAGLGFNLGLGVEYYLSPTLSFVAGGYQRWASFDQFRGFSNQYNQILQYGNPTSDAAGGLIFELGTTLGFE